MKMGVYGPQFFHRVVGLELCPITTDREGREVDPSFCTKRLMKQVEVHHGGGHADTHDCRAQNLFVLYKEHHRRLKKHKRR